MDICIYTYIYIYIYINIYIYILYPMYISYSVLCGMCSGYKRLCVSILPWGMGWDDPLLGNMLKCSSQMLSSDDCLAGFVS